MISGHFGVAAVLVRTWPRLDLWWLVPAAVAPDLLDIAFALAGVCNPSGLYSHTVPAAVLLGACLGGAATLAGHRATGVAVLVIVLLHLPLDYVTGRKLFWPGGELHGLMLYDLPLANFVLETVLLSGGWLLLRPVPARPWWARSPWLLAPLLLVQGLSALSRDGIKPTACGARQAQGAVPARDDGGGRPSGSRDPRAVAGYGAG